MELIIKQAFGDYYKEISFNVGHAENSHFITISKSYLVDGPE